jgi:hypothetical protein
VSQSFLTHFGVLGGTIANNVVTGIGSVNLENLESVFGMFIALRFMSLVPHLALARRPITRPARTLTSALPKICRSHSGLVTDE